MALQYSGSSPKCSAIAPMAELTASAWVNRCSSVVCFLSISSALSSVSFI